MFEVLLLLLLVCVSAQQSTDIKLVVEKTLPLVNSRDGYLSYGLLFLVIFATTLFLLKCANANAASSAQTVKKYYQDKSKFIQTNTDVVMSRNYSRLGALRK
jgi:hypothetical protein